jgi:hypothetical protein
MHAMLENDSRAQANLAPGASSPPGAHPRDTVPIPPWAAVLGSFYERLGLACPAFERLAPGDLPQPYHKLLAHSQDMTSTLEQFYAGPVRLEVLGRDCVGDTYTREVVLQLDRTRQPVEYGAICIHLRNFADDVQRIILSEQHPFGRILETEGVGYLSWPQAFFRVKADRHMSQLLTLNTEPVLYGRRNVLLDGRRRLLAEVIEILAPVLKAPSLTP